MKAYQLIVILFMIVLSTNGVVAQPGNYSNYSRKKQAELRQTTRRIKERIIQESRERHEREQWMKNFQKEQEERMAVNKRRLQLMKESPILGRKTFLDPRIPKAGMVPQFHDAVECGSFKLQRSWDVLPVAPIEGLELDRVVNLMVLLRNLKNPQIPGIAPPSEPLSVLRDY